MEDEPMTSTEVVRRLVGAKVIATFRPGTRFVGHEGGWIAMHPEEEPKLVRYNGTIEAIKASVPPAEQGEKT